MTQAAASANAYLRTRVLTARPEQLRLMLIDGAIRFTRQGRDGLAAKDYEASYNGFSRARDIILELMNSLRPDVDPELCKQVGALYTFLYMHLVEGSHEKDLVKVDKVIELLEYDRETWLLLMDQLTRETSASTSPAHAAAAPATPSERPALCIQG